MPKILFFGEPLIRISPENTSHFSNACQSQLFYGGSEINIARALQGFGQATSIATALPNSTLGDTFCQFLQENHIDTSHIQRLGKRIGLYYLENSFGCRQGEVNYDRENSSLHDFSIDQIDFETFFKDVTLFHFSGITLTLSQSIREMLKTLIIEAKKREILISFDLNFRSHLIAPTKAKLLFSKFAEYADICFGIEPLMLNNDDTLFFDRETATTQDIETRMMQLIKHFRLGKIFHTTRSQDEWGRNHYQAYLATNQNEFIASQTVKTKVNQRVGSGDAFVAGVLYQLLQAADPIDMINFGVASASLKCTLEGDNMFEPVYRVHRVLNQATDIIR